MPIRETDLPGIGRKYVVESRTGDIGGLTYKPKALESVEVALDDLLIEWLRIEPGSPCVGKTIGDLRIREKTGALSGTFSGRCSSSASV